jgi:hypothetical protein
MRANYMYFEWEGSPCRVRMNGAVYTTSEQYQEGVGFVHAPLSSLLSEGKVLSKQEFERLLTSIAVNSNRRRETEGEED